MDLSCECVQTTLEPTSKTANGELFRMLTLPEVCMQNRLLLVALNPAPISLIPLSADNGRVQFMQGQR